VTHEIVRHDERVQRIGTANQQPDIGDGNYPGSASCVADQLVEQRAAFRDGRRVMNRSPLGVVAVSDDALVSHSWPGNIRELQNLIERAVIRSAGDELHVPLDDLDDDTEIAGHGDADGTLEEAERLHILATLKKSRWVLSGPRGAAARLGINRSTLQFRMKKLGIMRPPVSTDVSA